MAQEKWEYMTQFVLARLEGQGVKEYLKKRWPNFTPVRFSPETMILSLNALGEVGWELVSMQPVRTDKDGSVIIPTTGGDGSGAYEWTSVYFCAFKRRISE